MGRPVPGSCERAVAWECHWRVVARSAQTQGVDGPLAKAANVNNRRVPTGSACPLSFPPLARLVLSCLSCICTTLKRGSALFLHCQFGCGFLVHFPFARGRFAPVFVRCWFGCWVGCSLGKVNKTFLALAPSRRNRNRNRHFDNQQATDKPHKTVAPPPVARRANLADCGMANCILETT